MSRREHASRDIDEERGVLVAASSQRPANLYQALMEAAPGDSIEVSRADRMPLREILADAIDSLTDEERYVFEALVLERRPIRSVAAEIGVSKSWLHETNQRTCKQLADMLQHVPEIQEYLMGEPTTWEEAATQISNRTFALPMKQDLYGVSLDTIRRRVRWIGTASERPKPQMMSAIARCGLYNYLTALYEMPAEHLGREAVDATAAKVLATVISKQHDYGHQNIAEYGRLGIVVRLSDKLARIENLTRRGTKAQHESLLDSWLDIAGYGLIGTMWERGLFMLPMHNDKHGPDEGAINE